MRPARSNTLRCLEIAGPLISNGSASSETVAWPEARRSRIARLVGSARALNVLLSCDSRLETIRLNNQCVKYLVSESLSTALQCKSRIRMPHGPNLGEHQAKQSLELKA